MRAQSVPPQGQGGRKIGARLASLSVYEAVRVPGSDRCAPGTRPVQLSTPGMSSGASDSGQRGRPNLSLPHGVDRLLGPGRLAEPDRLHPARPRLELRA